MRALFGFVVGYIVGAKAGSSGFDRVEQAVRDLRRSDEFERVVEALKEQAKETAQAMNRRLSQGGG